MELTRNSRESQGIATNSTGLSDKLSALGNGSVTPGGIGNRTGSGSGTGTGSGSGMGTGSGFGTGIGSGSRGTGSGGSGGTGTGNGSGSGSTVATGSGAIRQGGNRNGDSTGSGSGSLACRNCSKPKYPDRARRQGVEGTAKIKVDVDDKGNVTNVQVAQSTGNSELDRAAIRAARRWKFDTPNGARQGVTAKVDFALEGSKRSRQIRERQRQRAATRRKPSSATENATRTPAAQRTVERSTPTRRVRRTSTAQPASTSLPRRPSEVSAPRRQRVRSQSPIRSQQAAPNNQSRLYQSLRRSLQPLQQPSSAPKPANTSRLRNPT